MGNRAGGLPIEGKREVLRACQRYCGWVSTTLARYAASRLAGSCWCRL